MKELLAFILVVFSLCSSIFPEDQGRAESQVAEKIVSFARRSMAKRVGNGECWTLADEALKYAGARRPHEFGEGIYVFGRRLLEDELVKPGDIVQMYSARFVHKTGPRSWSYAETGEKHTAIVASVDGDTITVYHQNWSGHRTVSQWSFRPSEKTAGTVEFYRPEPGSANH